MHVQLSQQIRPTPDEPQVQRSRLTCHDLWARRWSQPCPHTPPCHEICINRSGLQHPPVAFRPPKHQVSLVPATKSDHQVRQESPADESTRPTRPRFCEPAQSKCTLENLHECSVLNTYRKSPQYGHTFGEPSNNNVVTTNHSKPSRLWSPISLLPHTAPRALEAQQTSTVAGVPTERRRPRTLNGRSRASGHL